MSIIETLDHTDPIIRSRFFAKTRRSENGCLEWTASQKGRGRGQFSLYHHRPINIVRTASRVAFWLEHGVWPQLACHTCDNPLCVDHTHLFEGTNADNSADMVKKGRQVRGEKQHMTKLTEAMVSDMRRLRIEGWSKQMLADRFQVDHKSVYNICHYVTWKHVP